MKYLFSVLIAFGFLGSTQAARFHVTPTAKSGSSGKKWSKAATLHDALRLAGPGDEIWVKRGLYLTSSSGLRTVSFIVPAGITLIGGFSGREDHLGQRPADGKSTLSGELGVPHDHSDNAYTVVTLKPASMVATLLQGFNIVGGSSKSFTDGRGERNAGGGLYLERGAAAGANHQIKNCTFEDNQAHNGGAVMINGGRPVFSNCQFATNTADFSGGAVYNDGSNGLSSPTFEQCLFVDNASSTGAGLTNDSENGETSPLLVGCKFIDNISLINGSAIFNRRQDTGTGKPILEDCEFIGNESILGDDVYDLGGGAHINKLEEKVGRVGGTLRPSVATVR